MEDKEIDLLSKTIDIIREDVQRQLAEIKTDVRKLETEYDAVLVEQKALRIAQDLARKEAMQRHRRTALLISVAAVIATFVPALIQLFHL